VVQSMIRGGLCCGKVPICKRDWHSGDRRNTISGQHSRSYKDSASTDPEHHPIGVTTYRRR
jgi:hypothetical protein